MTALTLELDTNSAENQFRLVSLKRKNALFAGDAGDAVGAENRAMLASLVATCKMPGANPVDDIAVTLRAILDGHPQSSIEDLMPWRYALPSSLAAKHHAVALTGHLWTLRLGQSPFQIGLAVREERQLDGLPIFPTSTSS